MQKSDSSGMHWVFWFIATVFFAYQFILRLAPGLIISQIMHKYDVDATEYGLFSALYYVGYAGMQIPVAILLDKYGPRIIGAIFVSVCALSSWIFITTDSWAVVLICRVLLGAGSAAGFLTVSKVISIWFSPKSYGRMVGASFSVGLLGAVYGGRPVNSLIDLFGWSNVIFVIAMVGFVVAALFILFIPRYKPNAHELEEDDKILRKLRHVCTNKNIIFLALSNLLMVGPLEGFADVWGVSYIVNVYGYTKSDAATITSFIFIGMIIGAPVLALLAEKMNANYGLVTISGLYMSLAFFAMILLREHMSLAALYFITFFVGVACCYQVLMFSIGSSIVKPQFVGITVAFLNSINMFGGTFFHSLIGSIMDYFWSGEMKDATKLYGIESYNYSLISIPIAALVGTVILVVLMSKSKKMGRKI